jgi:hypothetical protein
MLKARKSSTSAMEVSMKAAAVGLRVHSGWTSLVVVAFEKGKPAVLTRQRPHLVQTFSYAFRQPYHTAEGMSLHEAEDFLGRQRSEARRLAGKALEAVQRDAAQQGYKVTRAALLTASGRPLPELAKILAAHSLIHAADGEFFREALLHACRAQRLAVTVIKDRELLAAGGARFKRRPAALAKQLAELGKPVGPPWSQDEKFATLAAWLALASRT